MIHRFLQVEVPLGMGHSNPQVWRYLRSTVYFCSSTGLLLRILESEAHSVHRTLLIKWVFYGVYVVEKKR